MGKAYKVKGATGAMKAVKVTCDLEHNRMTANEYQTLCDLRHPNIATVYAHFAVCDLNAFEMNFYAGGTCMH